jgi:hypothetical protein
MPMNLVARPTLALLHGVERVVKMLNLLLVAQREHRLVGAGTTCSSSPPCCQGGRLPQAPCQHHKMVDANVLAWTFHMLSTAAPAHIAPLMAEGRAAIAPIGNVRAWKEAGRGYIIPRSSRTAWWLGTGTVAQRAVIRLQRIDVYARVCSCRQCWASKCRGL